MVNFCIVIENVFRKKNYFFPYFLEGLKESDIIKAAIILDLDSNPEVVNQLLSNLSACIKHGNCELPVKNFKYVNIYTKH